MHSWSEEKKRAAHFLSGVFSNKVSLQGLANSDGWSFSNPLPSSEGTEPRYSNVPSEAFPFLSAGVDGCHYALWIDDESSMGRPSVVWVRPMDGTPETVQLITTNVQEFQARVLEAGLRLEDGPDPSGTQVLMARQALVARQELVRFTTRDSLGVVCANEPIVERPTEQDLDTWRESGDGSFRGMVSNWLALGSPGQALAVARDLIADFDAPGIPGFSAALADIYTALKRPALADVARLSYT